MTHIVGGFLQNEWRTEKFSLLIGGRLDKHNLMDKAVFSPRANIRYSPTESVGLRASLFERLPRTAGLRRRPARGCRGRRPQTDCPRTGPETGVFQQFQPVGRPLPPNWTGTDQPAHRRILYQTRRRLHPRPDRRGCGRQLHHGAPQRFGSYRQGIQFRGQDRDTQSVRTPIGIHPAEQLVRPAASSGPKTPTLPAQRKMFRTPDSYGYFTSTGTSPPGSALRCSRTYTGTMLVNTRSTTPKPTACRMRRR